VDGIGARGLPCAGTASGARSTLGTSAGATSAARSVGWAGAGDWWRTDGAMPWLPCRTDGARETAGAFGDGVGLGVRSLAETTSTRFALDPASWTSPPPTRARSRFRSSLSWGCSAER